MSVYFNDPEYIARVDREAAANPSHGPMLGAWHQAALGLGRGAVMAADAARMAYAVPVIAFNDDETQDRYFAATDAVINSAMDRYTPDPETTTFVGRTMGAAAEAIAPLLAGGGNPSLLMASAQTRTSRSLIEQGVDASTARDTGMVDALAIGAGFMIPAFGSTLARKLAFGAVSNPALGAASTGIQSAALNEAGYPEAAKQYDPYDLEARGIDAILGAAFGGISHFTGAHTPELGLQMPGRVAVETLDALLAYRGAQRWDSHALTDTIAGRNAHDAAMRVAMGQAIRGEPISVRGDPSFEPPPEMDAAAIGRQIAEDVFRPAHHAESPENPTLPSEPVDPIEQTRDEAAPFEKAATLLKVDQPAPVVVAETRTRSEAAAQRYAKEAKIDTTSDDLLAAIAKEGGISREAAEAAGIDPAEFKRNGWRIKKVFTAKGLSLEAMSERLASHGYPVTDAAGYGENPMLSALDRSLRGEKVHAPEGLEARIAEQAAERDAAQAHEPMLADHEYGKLHALGDQQLLDAVERARDAGMPVHDLEAITELGGIHGYETKDLIRILDEETAQRRGANGGGDHPSQPGSGPDTGEKPAGEDIDLDMIPRAREIAAANRELPVMMPDEVVDRPAGELMDEADHQVREAETTFARAVREAANCLLG